MAGIPIITAFVTAGISPVSDQSTNVCALGQVADFSSVDNIVDIGELNPWPPLSDYLQAMVLANKQAETTLNEHMSLSWYDRDRDFESPQHASECHLDSAIPGYVDYGLNHGAQLRVDIEQGRFVFFYLGL